MQAQGAGEPPETAPAAAPAVEQDVAMAPQDNDDADDERLVVQDMDLKQQIAALQTSNNRWSSRANELEAENTRLKQQLQRISGGTDVEEMESLDDLKRKKAQAEATVSEIQVRLDGMAASNKELEAELAGMHERSKKLSDENCKYLNDSVAQAKLSQELRLERDELRAREVELKAKLESRTQNEEMLKGINKQLEAELMRVEEGTTATIVELRAELEAAKAEADGLRNAVEQKDVRLKQAIADVESQEDERAQLLEGLRDDVAALTAKVEASESARASQALVVDRKTAEIEHLMADNARIAQQQEDAEARLEELQAESRAEIEQLADARNLAESEVVRLRTQLNAIHPLLKVPDPDADPAAGDAEQKVPMPFTFSEIAETMEELATTKAKLATLQASHRDMAVDRSVTADAVSKERMRAEHLAGQVVDLKYTVDMLQKEKAARDAWQDKHKVQLEQAGEAHRMNEILSTQLQHMLKQQDEEGTLQITGGPGADGDVLMVEPPPFPSLATPGSTRDAPHDAAGVGALQVFGGGAREAKLPIEFSTIQEMQQQNARLHVALEAAQAKREEELAEARAGVESACKAEVDALVARYAPVIDERDRLQEELASTVAKCHRLAETVEACSKYDRALTMPDMPHAAALRSSTGGAAPAPKAGKAAEPTLPPAVAAKHKELTDQLNAARADIDKLKAECLEEKRLCDTVEARRQHIEALHESARNNITQLELERDHYKAQLSLSEKTNEEMMKHVIESQDRLKEFKFRTADAEGKLDLAQDELKRLYNANSALLDSQSSMDDVLVQVSGVRTFLTEHKSMKEGEIKMERDQARQALAKKEQELQEVNQTLREHRSKHDKERTNIQAELTTAREQLAATNKMLDVEKEQHRQQILNNRRLGEDLLRCESELKILKQTDTVEETNYLATGSSGAEELKRQLRDLQTTLDAKNTAIGGYKKANDALETHMRQAQTKRKEDAQAIEKLMAEVDRLKALEVSRQKKWDETTKSLADREAAVQKQEESFKSELDALRNERATLQKTLDDGEAGRVDANERCRKAEEAKEMLQTRYESAAIEIGELQQEVLGLKAVAERVRAVEASPAPEVMSPARESETREQNMQLREELQAAHKLLASVEPAKEIAEADMTAYMDALRGRNKGLEQDLRNAALEVKIAEAKIEQLRRQAQAAAPLGQPDVVAKMERRIQNLKDEHQQRTERLTAELKAATAQRDELSAKLAAATKPRDTPAPFVGFQLRQQKPPQQQSEEIAELRKKIETLSKQATQAAAEAGGTSPQAGSSPQQSGFTAPAAAPPLVIGGKRPLSSMMGDTEATKVRRTDAMFFVSSSQTAAAADTAQVSGTSTPEPPATSPSPDQPKAPSTRARNASWGKS